MNKKASNTLIGAFVVGAAILIAAGLVIFGGGKVMEERNEYVLFFQGSVKGLNVGAPVLFSGVKIGSVKSISIEYNAETAAILVPVIIEVYPERFRLIKGRYLPIEKALHRWIEKGLRAQLCMSSFITAQLNIEMEYRPDTPINLAGLDKKHLEIPTIPSTFEHIFDALKQLPLREFFERLMKTVGALEKIVESPEIPEILQSLKAVLSDAGNLIQHVDDRVDPLTGTLNDTLMAYQKLATHVDAEVGPLADGAQSAIGDARKLMVTTDKKIQTMAKRIDKALKASDQALEQAKATLMVVEKRVGRDSPLLNQFNNTLTEFSEMVRSIRSFVNYLSRHPEALIRGKSSPHGR